MNYALLDAGEEEESDSKYSWRQLTRQFSCNSQEFFYFHNLSMNTGKGIKQSVTFIVFQTCLSMFLSALYCLTQLYQHLLQWFLQLHIHKRQLTPACFTVEAAFAHTRLSCLWVREPFCVFGNSELYLR